MKTKICLVRHGITEGNQKRLYYGSSDIPLAEEGVAITVFFDEDATESQIEEIGKELRSRDDVLKVEYVSEDDAWNSFKE